jgi:hypothetical protein
MFTNFVWNINYLVVISNMRTVRNFEDMTDKFNIIEGIKKVNLSLQQAVKAHRFVRRRGSHIFVTIGSQMVMRLSALRPGSPVPPGRFLVPISLRSWVDLRAIVRLEGLGELKKFNVLIGNRILNYRPCNHLPMKTKRDNTAYFVKLTRCLPARFVPFPSVNESAGII